MELAAHIMVLCVIEIGAGWTNMHVTPSAHFVFQTAHRVSPNYKIPESQLEVI
jgi:hypothetical protein